MIGLEIVKASVHYNSEGKSLGSAEVTFQNKATATKAVEEYDGAEVDGRPMYLKAIGSLAAAPRVITKAPRQQFAPPRQQFDNYANYGTRSRTAGRLARQFEDRRPTRGGRGAGRGGRGGARKSEPVKSIEDLDAEMDSYQSARGSAEAASSVADGQPVVA